MKDGGAKEIPHLDEKAQSVYHVSTKICADGRKRIGFEHGAYDAEFASALD